MRVAQRARGRGDRPERKEEELPDGWSQAWDPRSRRAFYKNDVHKYTTWVRPVREARLVPNPPPLLRPEAREREEAERPLPDGWEERWDGEKSRKYYANSFTRTTTYTRPRHPAAVVAVLLREAGGNLPDGWSAHVCPKTGRTYFSNTVHGSTQWTRPSRPARDYPAPAGRRAGRTGGSTVAVAEMYRTVLRAVVVDGRIAPAEEQMLSELRERHHISVAEHDAALRSLGLGAEEVARMRLGDAAGGGQKEEQTLCVICLDEPVTNACLPCMHMCVCGECGPRLRGRDCPICRSRVREVRRVFI